LIENMWPYLDTVWMRWVMHVFISVCGHIHLLLCTFLMVFSFLGNLQDCKEYSEAHYCWANSKIQNWLCWIRNTYLGLPATNFSRLYCPPSLHTFIASCVHTSLSQWSKITLLLKELCGKCQQISLHVFQSTGFKIRALHFPAPIFPLKSNRKLFILKLNIL